MINSMEELIQQAQNHATATAVVAGAAGREVLESIKKAREDNVLEPLLVGDKDKIRGIAEEVDLSLDEDEIISASGSKQICSRSVELLASDEADLLMKGLVETSSLLKEILRDEYDLKSKQMLSHVVLAEVPALDRLIFISDGGMNICPDQNDKAAIVQNVIDCARKLGWEDPRVALLAAVEKTREDMPETLDAAVISKMADRGQISGGIVEGPFALDNALSSSAAKIKGLSGPVAGKADILITPNISSGNLLGKSVIYFAGGRFAAFLGGTEKPVVVTSRSDSAEIRYISLAAAAAMV